MSDGQIIPHYEVCYCGHALGDHELPEILPSRRDLPCKECECLAYFESGGPEL